MSETAQARNEGLWFLEGFTEESGPVRRVPILSLPFEIGRHPGLGMTLVSDLVSQHHAVISRSDAGTLEIRDLGSTNGTFLNSERLQISKQIREGDIVHFARFEFRLGMVGAEDAEQLLANTIAISDELPQLMIDRSRILREVMRRRDVTSVFQPIVSMSDCTTFGFEVFGRGLLHGARTPSTELFTAAQALGAEAELSRLFRSQSIEDCRLLPGQPTIFINTHPAEIGSPELRESLREFRRQAPQLSAVLEIHESAITSPQIVREISDFLREIDIGLAYDDFGAGQARLQELAAIQPDFLKFDISLIRNIDSAPASRHHILASLVDLALGLEIAPIAEGIESEAEAEICKELGFAYGQGFLFGAPAPAEQLTTASPG